MSAQEAAARVAALVKAGAADVPPDWRPLVIPLREEYVARTRPILWTVTAAAALVLLVACANAAALLLVRGVGRQKEIAVRRALGATRAALARMLTAEALVFGFGATVIGVAASSITLGWLAPMVQQQLGRPAPGGLSAFAVDAATMAMAMAMGIATTVICTAAPLIGALRVSVQQSLQNSTRGATEGSGSRRMRAALIALEVAVSLSLLAGSTLMLRSVIAMLRTDLGFTTDRVLLASVTLRQHRYPTGEARQALFDRLEARLGEMPGAVAAGMSTAWPLQPLNLQSVSGAAAGSSALAGIQRVNAAYFTALDIPIVRGRGFARTDRQGTEPVALVSETLATRLWPGGNAVGQLLVLGEVQEGDFPVSVSRRVIGVARDVRQGPSDEDLSDVYVPMPQAPGRFAFVLTRTSGDPAAWLEPLRQAFREIDPEIAVQTARPLRAVVDELVARPRFLAALLGAFAGMSALLALVGVYGVIAYAVGQRGREIAVRMALGAAPAQVTRLFIRQGARILSAGLALGLVGAAAAGRLLEHQLFGVHALDPIALALAVIGFAVAGLLAVWWPARRAAHADPAVVLRVE